MGKKACKPADCWKYFKLVKVHGENWTKCNLCDEELRYSGGTTSTMINHLKWKHKKTKLSDESESAGSSARQTTLLAFNQKAKELSKKRQTEITQSLALACAIEQ